MGQKPRSRGHWMILVSLVALVATEAKGFNLAFQIGDGRSALAGGRAVSLTWSPESALPPDAVEWEAFLSVDGGRYYAARLTPHLGRDLRSTTVFIPNVASRDARILIRVGNERQEREIEVAARFSIEPSSDAPLPLAATADHLGEPARAAQPGVAVWTSGARDGSGVRLVRARAKTCSAPATMGAAPLTPSVALLQPDTSVATVPLATAFTIPDSGRRPAVTGVLPLAADRLLQTRRLNI